MAVGHFLGGVAALVRCPATGRYLLLRRAPTKDFAPGGWECVTGRVDQGEGFEEALRREVREELGVEVRIDFMIGTTHFYRGEASPENELVGVIYACSLENPEAVRLTEEHSECRWASPEEAAALLTEPDACTQWTRRVVERAEAIRRLLPEELLSYYQKVGFELD
jgi:8-oxo-dGTP diphosphatase